MPDHVGACRHRCPGGQHCASTDHKHHYHCCKAPGCICREQYGPVAYDVPPRKLAASYIVLGRLNLFALLKHIRATSRRGSPLGAKET